MPMCRYLVRRPFCRFPAVQGTPCDEIPGAFTAIQKVAQML